MLRTPPADADFRSYAATCGSITQPHQPRHKLESNVITEHTVALDPNSFQQGTLLLKDRCATVLAREILQTPRTGATWFRSLHACYCPGAHQPAPRTHTNDIIAYLEVIRVVSTSPGSPFGADMPDRRNEAIHSNVRNSTKWDPIDLRTVPCYTEETYKQCRRVIMSFRALFENF